MTDADGPVDHAALTERNRRIVTDFARIFYGERDVRTAFETYVDEHRYVQHSPMVADGRAAAIAGLSSFFSAEGSHFEVKRILVDGDLALVHLVGSPAGRPPVAVADVFRLEDGRIVEHWDVKEPIPDTAVHGNPMV